MLEWFTTIPGILVICGAVLLVIAIILFILGNKKDTKNKVADVNNDNAFATSDLPASNEVQNFSDNSVDSTVIDFQNTNVESEVTDQETAINIDEPVSAEVSINENNFEQPIIIEDQNIDNTSFGEVSTEESAPIYGGEVPTYNIEMPEEKPISIYGGNDPLEATQNLPKIEETREPYSGYSEVNSTFDDIPSISNFEAEPVVDTPIAMPEVEVTPVQDIAPVEEAPVVMPEVEVTPVQNVTPVEETPVVTEQPEIEEL